MKQGTRQKPNQETTEVLRQAAKHQLARIEEQESENAAKPFRGAGEQRSKREL